MKTIKQIAEELDVSKQAVQKRIAREPLCTSISPYISMHGNTKYIDDDGVDIIKSAFQFGVCTKPAATNNLSIDSNSDTHNLIVLLQDELNSKNELIEQMQMSISDLTSALSASQALHAGTIQQQLYKSQNLPEGNIKRVPIRIRTGQPNWHRRRQQRISISSVQHK